MTINRHSYQHHHDMAFEAISDVLWMALPVIALGCFVLWLIF